MRWLLVVIAAMVGVAVAAGTLGSAGAGAAVSRAGAVGLQGAVAEQMSQTCTPAPAGGGVQVQGEGAVLAARAASTAGWAGPDLRVAVALAGAESGFDPRAGNELADGRTHQGLYQISSLHGALIAKYGGDRFDPVANARMAHELWVSVGRKWSPTWEAYTNGSWRKYLPDADRALQQLTVDERASSVVASTVARSGGEGCVPGAGGTTGAEGTVLSTCAEGGQQEVGRQGQPIVICTVRGIPINRAVSGNLEQMFAAVEAGGHKLGGSGWRSHQRQVELYAQNCHGGRCSPPTARPGTSNHEDGLAADFTCDGQLIRSRSNPCYRILAQGGGGAGTPEGSFNFAGAQNLPSEAWHWNLPGANFTWGS